MPSYHKRVRSLNGSERSWVIQKVEDAEFRRLLWHRARVWRNLVGAGLFGALAYVNFANDFLEALGKLFSTLGWK